MSGIAVSRYLRFVLWSVGLPKYPIENAVLSEGWLPSPFDHYAVQRVTRGSLCFHIDEKRTVISRLQKIVYDGKENQSW